MPSSFDDAAAVFEATPVKELSEAEQVRALTQGLGLDDPALADGHGLTGFGEDVTRGGDDAQVHGRQAQRVDSEEMAGFGQGERPAPTQVSIKGGAKPTGHGQPIPQGALVGRPGMQAAPVVGRPGVVGGPAAPAVVSRPAYQLERFLPTPVIDTMKAAAMPDTMKVPDTIKPSPNAPAYESHPGEDRPEPGLTLTQGQVNTLSRLLDAALPNPQALLTAVALKASVEVAGMEGVSIDWTAAELSEIDRRATFWGLTRAESIRKMMEQVKSYMFESSSM